MNAVLMSIRPEWCEKILSGEKTIEIRKTRPKLQPPFKVYIYCTTPQNVRNKLWQAATYHYCDDHSHNGPDRVVNRKVIAEFVCESIERFGVPYPAFQKQMRQDILEKSCLRYYDLHRYAYHDALFAWHIADLKIYDKPKMVEDFYRPGAPDLEELQDTETICTYCEATDLGSDKFCQTPNGYWSCEGRWCEEAYEEYLNQNFMLTRPPQSWCYVESLPEVTNDAD